jgi:hypothetical protein
MNTKIYIGENVEVVISPTQSTTTTNFNMIDLYNDETINLTSKLSDIEKLSNVFTDFTNTFTIPATENNSNLFRHYYDIDIYNTFNANIRVLGYLEIDTFPLRYGKIQLESINLKSGRPESYKITFYGGLVQLTDLFDDDTIDRLDFDEEGNKVRDVLGQYNFDYTETNIIQSLNKSFKGGDIITPLISYTDRDWNIGTGDTTDISILIGTIRSRELKQAIRIIRLIEGIESKYNISFSRNFFGKAVFNNLFMWLNGRNTNSFYFDFDTPLTIQGLPPSPGMQGYLPSIDLLTDIVSVEMFDVPSRADSFILVMYWPFNSNGNLRGIYDTSFNVTITLEDQRPGREGNIIYNVIRSFENTDLHYENVDFSASALGMDFVTPLQFKIKMSFNVPVIWDTFRLGLQFTYLPPNDNFLYEYRSDNGDSRSISISNIVPNMKVIDFIQGIMKMFKLVIRPLTGSNFYVDTLDGYYSNGSLLDITGYTDFEDVLVERPLIYREIKYKFEKTNNVAGKKFRSIYDPTNDEIGYGDLKARYASVETKDILEVKLPFENMMFDRITRSSSPTSEQSGVQTNVLIGQSISPNDDYTQFTPNNSKPILFFNNGVQELDTPIYFRFSSSIPVVLNSSYVIGNTDDLLLNQVTNAINWGAEIDPWHNTTIYNSLFNNYWKNWIDTIYSLKQRKFSFTCYLPPRFIEELSLNDRIIIGSHRYKINDYTLNLNDGKTKLNLIVDIYDNYEQLESLFTGSVFNWSGFYNYLYFTDFTNANEDGSYFLYGSFITYNGVTTSRVIKIRKDGLQDTTFNANLGGPNSEPYAGMRLYRYNNDSLLVAGYYSSYNGVSGFGIRKLHPNGTIDTSLTPRTFGAAGGFRYTTKCEVQQDGKIVLAGLFASYDGNGSRCLVRVNTDGSYDNTLVVGSTGFNNTTMDVIVNQDNSMYVSGYFTSYKGTTCNGIVKLTATGSIDSSFVLGTGFSPSGTGNSYYLLPTYDNSNSVYVCGDTMTSYKGATAGRVIKLTSTGTIDTSFNVGTGVTSGQIYFIRYTENNERICLSGSFSQFNGQTTNNVVIVNLDGSIYQTFPQTNYDLTYNVGNDVYGTDKVTYQLTKLTSDLQLQIYTSYIEVNVGSKYYGIDITSNSDWTMTKMDLGWGTDWIDLLTPNGSGNTELQIYIKDKTSQTAPQLNQDRVMGIKVKSGDIEKWITIRQKGL